MCNEGEGGVLVEEEMASASGPHRGCLGERDVC